jgi:uncharacterized protein
MDLFIIPVEEGATDKYIIYRPLLGLAFIGNRAMVDLASNPEDSGFTNPEAASFLADIGFRMPDVQPPERRRGFSTAVLLLTNRCQLRCTYCYARAGELVPISLSALSGIAVIDYVARQAAEDGRDSFRVDFHGGGEPTLEWALLQELTAHARSKSLKAEVSITSNAVWSESQCNWLAENVDQISVSMDGSPQTQDRNRPLATGGPSSPVVIKSLRSLDEHHVKYGIRMTVQHPWNTLPEDVRFILENTSCRSIQVEPTFNLSRGGHCYPIEDQCRAFEAAFVDTYSLAKSYQTRVSTSGARPELITDVFCASPYEALVVNPEDRIVACYEITSEEHPFAALAAFGRVKQGRVVLDQAARERFARLAEERLETCKDCFCIWHCAGDCFTRAFSTGESGHLAKNQRCAMNRSLTRFTLMDLIASGGGVWRKFQLESMDSHG